MSSLLSQCLDYFVGTRSEHLPELYHLSHKNTAAANEKADALVLVPFVPANFLFAFLYFFRGLNIDDEIIDLLPLPT